MKNANVNLPHSTCFAGHCIRLPQSLGCACLTWSIHFYYSTDHFNNVPGQGTPWIWMRCGTGWRVVPNSAYGGCPIRENAGAIRSIKGVCALTSTVTGDIIVGDVWRMDRRIFSIER